MINADNSVASFANGLDKPNGGYVKASVVRGPDDAGAFTLRLDGGREVSVVVEEGDAKAKMAPGQNVLINLSDGKILIPNAAQGQQGRQPQQTPLTGQLPQPAQTLPAELPQNLPAGMSQQSPQSTQALPAGMPQQSSQMPPTGQPQQSPQSTQTPPAGMPPQSSQIPLTGQPQQPPQSAQTTVQVQPFVSINADVFIAGELVKQIRDGLESPLLRSLPAELIEKIASERGGIDVAALNALDAVLRNRSLPFDASSPLVLERLEQWLRLALDNPKLAEDLADRVPLLGAREIIDKFLQLNKLGANFLPENLLQKLSAERFFLGNETGAGQNLGPNAGNAVKTVIDNNLSHNAGVGLNAGNALNNANISNNLNNKTGTEINVGLNAGKVINNAPQNSVSISGATIKELFAKAFSAAPAALLDLVKRIDSYDINANGAKLPPEEARKIAGELVNRLPAQAAEKPELVHKMKQLPPRVAEASAAPIIPNKAELPNAPIIQNKPESSNTHIIPNKSDSPMPIIPNKADSPITTVIPNKSESPNTHIIPNKPESSASIIPNKADSTVATVIPNKPESSNAHIILNKSELSTPIIPNKTDSTITTIIPNKADSSAQPPANSLLEPSRDARHPVPQNVYDRIESASRFNIPTESKNALFSQIGAAQEAIRSVIDGNTRAADASVAAVRQTVNNDINSGISDNKPIAQFTQQATISEINKHASQFTQAANTPVTSSPQLTQVASNTPASPPLTSTPSIPTQQATVPTASSPILSPLPPTPPQTTAAGEMIVKQAVSNDINTVNLTNKPTVQLTQQASAPVTSSPQFTQVASAPVISSPQLTQVASNPPAPPPLTSTLPQSTPQPSPQTIPPQSTLPSSPQTTPPQSTPLPSPQPILPQITATNNATVGQAPPDMLTQAARRFLDNTEKLRVGFQEAFSSLDLQSRVFPSDFSGGSESSAVRQSLDALRLETLLNASKALQDIFSIVEELRGVAELFSDKPREPTDAEKLLARAAENLARQARTCGGEIADRLSDALRELNRMQSDASKSDGGLPARQSPAEIMRSAALTAAGGLESLHLLASAARGQELQQQVVALPVKIGEEWTELQVKIIKERKGKEKKEKKEGGGHVSVYLNAAPSKLGEVTAHLDYYPPASLKLSFQFGKPEATKWFRERAAGLREALSAAGLPGAALEFHTKPRPARAQSAENQAVKPVGAGTVDSLGRVDFRV